MVKIINIPGNHSLLLNAFIKKLMAEHVILNNLVPLINDQQGKALLVGGAVRDCLWGLPVKDIDIEVHGISLDTLEDILRTVGVVSMVGKSFGVLKIHGLDIDWSIPRSDSSGRKPTVSVDPHMPIEDAFRRRDLTINALGIDLSKGLLIDPFGGLNDIIQRRLRAVDAYTFIEDPLRFFRVMQFIGRFEVYPDESLNELCRTMDISTISRERIEDEFDKLLLKSKTPSRGFVWLRTINRLSEVLPEIAALIGVMQKKQYHPEGDAFEHTMQTLDAAASFAYESHEEKRIMVWAALCHDIGKATTTVQGDKSDYSCPKHAYEGGRLVPKCMRRITHKVELINTVKAMVIYHMAPHTYVENNARPAAYKRLAKALSPFANIRMLAQLARADSLGRNPLKGRPLNGPVQSVDEFELIVQQLGIDEEPEPPLLRGRDFLDVVPPSSQLGDLVKKAYEIQIEEHIHDKAELKHRTLSVFDVKQSLQE